MLHGAVGNNILNYSQWALLPTAWSISLEWQFYLVAPVILLLMRRSGGAALISSMTIAGLWMYDRGIFGTFGLPSVLPGSAQLFLLGIVSRLCCDRVNPTAPVAVAIAVIGMGYLLDQLAIGLWVAFFVYMFCEKETLRGLDAKFARVADVLFASRASKWAGERTYSVYLVHFPIFQLLLTAFTWIGLRAPVEIAAYLLLFGLPLTIAAAEVVHRFIEVPGMELGRQVARSFNSWTPPAFSLRVQG